MCGGSISLQDEEYLFQGVKLTAKEKAELEYRKKTYDLASKLVRAARLRSSIPSLGPHPRFTACIRPPAPEVGAEEAQRAAARALLRDRRTLL